MAAFLGGGVPAGLAYLDVNPGAERVVADLILERLQGLYEKDRQNFFKNLAAAVQQGVAKAHGAK